MSIIAICGYRGHGKDTLYRAMRGMVNYQGPQFETHIFHKPRTEKLIYKLLRHPRILRFASADEIKRQMCRTYNISHEELEKKKDRPMKQAMCTYRDVMKSIAKKCLEKDKLCFVRKIEECEIDDETTIVVTDLRMKHEHEYLKEFAQKKGLEYITIRVFRPEVSIPEEDDSTEHGLDHLETDYFVGSTVGSINGFSSYLNIHDYFNRCQECTGCESERN